ncbi:GGDEF domain-containing protein [Novosphingobium sp. 1949]|uniref:diguanylate cyclase n=1 Tax=Novosphingobium organovorum TaxID=2930092 RepID=A0ABT0BDC6_9SPHN|nr:GGDEF domain-containing protein [Novosphingobium organovorum]MCJ2183072.1 GGDEF domain-containing protein [Novosphingobium organovorum]
MRFYHATKFLFPHDYERRMAAIYFLSMLLPAAFSISYQFIFGVFSASATLAVLLGTMTGALGGLFAIHGLLSPLHKATAMLRAIQAGEQVTAIPSDEDDLVGQLLGAVAAQARCAEQRSSPVETLSERDALTGIRNRRGFRSAAERLLPGDNNAVIALVDIDHFSLINDRFGLDAGDILLTSLARILEGNLRRTDLCCRWGGEEFAILFPDTLLDEARLVMERLRATIALDSSLLDASWPITLSCGIAPLRAFEDLDEAALRADSALTEAKESGRNRVRVARN